jgi:hypothetical protein
MRCEQTRSNGTDGGAVNLNRDRFLQQRHGQHDSGFAAALHENAFDPVRAPAVMRTL